MLGYDAEILRMFGVSTPVDPSMTTGQAAAWVGSLGKDGEIEWVVEHSDRLLGAARLHSFETGDRCMYAVGFFDKAKLGQGLGRIVTRLVLRHAFDDLGLKEVGLLVLDFNERALLCYRSCGFHEVTRVPSDVFDGDRIANDVVMRVTPSLFTSA
jgi:ribosomal-protein-alanine N-acetyltransferase